MPLTFLKNTGTAFVSSNKTTGVATHTGWWNSLAAGDFDNDGDIDYVAGNLGLNSNYKASVTEPMTICAKDFDQNGLLDPMVFCYMNAEDGSRKPFPVAAREDMISQMISVRKRYPTYKAYGRASIDDLYGIKDRTNALVYKANDFATSYFENKGNGRFAIRPLPVEAQTAPVFGMLAEDVNNDGNLDLLLVGNDYGMDPSSGRHDAFRGLYIKGNGAGDFTSVPLAQSGFFIAGDAKGLARIHTAKHEDIILATQNQDSLKVYARTSASAKWISLRPDDCCATVSYANNKESRLEFYYGSTYLSQSSRKIAVSNNIVKMVITNFKGMKRDAF